MTFFFDTSALVKFFYVESGTEIVTQIIEHADSEVWISDLARLGFISVLYRYFRNISLDEIRLHVATTYFEQQLGSFNIEPLNQLIIDEAGSFLKKNGKEYDLRTLDALHLSTYSLISEKGWCFVTSGAVLADVATLAGFLSLNPRQATDINLHTWMPSHA